MTTISEKRANETDDVSYKANVVLVDIEGTTTSIDFVKNTLFSYVRKNLEEYLKAKWNDDEFKEDLKLLQEQSKQDEADGTEGLVKIPEGISEDICEDVKKNILWQMDLDRKTKALKQVQGHIWQDAYKKGEVKAHVYPDVAPALKSWKQSGKDIYVYSSGSVEAQKLLFGHTEVGDLLELFSGYFDTTVGPKVEESSYSNIVKSMKCKSEEIIFFTDVPREARAAKSAGLQAVIVVREGNLPLTDEDKLEFPVIKSFDDIVFETSVKRRKKSEEEPLEHGKTKSAAVEVSDVQDVEMQEEPITDKSEASKATEGVSSTAVVEDVDVQPDSMKQTPIEQSTNVEAKQTICKDKDTVNNDLASTKQIDSKLVADHSATEVSEQNKSNETSSKTLEVNGDKKLDADSDKKQAESNGPKCPKDNLPKPDANNIDTPIKTNSDGPTNSEHNILNENKNTNSSSENCNDAAVNNLPVTDNVDIVVPDGKTDTKLTSGDKSRPNDKTETGERDSQISESSISSGKDSKESLSSDTTDSKSKVDPVKDKTESTLPNTDELSNKTEFTHSHKTENVCAKTECATTNSTESETCKTESLKPSDVEPDVTKTESEVNKTERMETDDLAPAPSSDLKPTSTDKDESMQKDKIEATNEAVPVSEVETDRSATDEKVKTAAPEAPSAAAGGKAEPETVPVCGKPEDVADPVSSKAEADPVSSKAEADPVSSKAEADPVSSKAEADPVSSKAEADPVSSKAEADPVSSKAEADPVSSKAEADPVSSKSVDTGDTAPAGDKAEDTVGATPANAKTNIVQEGASTGGTETAKSVSNTGGKAEAADSMEDSKVATVTSDVKADAAVGEVKGGNDSGVPKEGDEAMVTDDAEQVPADKAKPVVEDESEAMVTDEAEPMATDETKPVTEGVNHTSKNAESVVTEDPEPMVTNKDETINSTAQDGDGEKPKSTQPKKDTDTEENVPTDSPCVDNAKNIMNKDVTVKDTNDSITVVTEKGNGEISDTKTDSSNTENKITKTDNENDVDSVKENKNEEKNSTNSCVENGDSAEKTDNSEKLKVAAESADKVSENVVSN